MREVRRIVTGPEATTLIYPNSILKVGKPEYDGGGLITFVMLELPCKPDDIYEACVAVVDNRARDRSVSLGAGVLHQVVSGEPIQSGREVGIRVFKQSVDQRAIGSGEFTVIGASDIDPHSRYAITGIASSEPPQYNSRIPTIAQRWAAGSAQLSPSTVFTMFADSHQLCGIEDLKQVLNALELGVPSTDLTMSVEGYEVSSWRNAKVMREEQGLPQIASPL